MKAAALLLALVAPLTAQAQNEAVPSPDLATWHSDPRGGGRSLDGRTYFADNDFLWVTEAAPDAFTVVDTMQGDGCDNDERSLDAPPIVYDGALYFIEYADEVHYPCARSLWRYRPGGRIERIAAGPQEAEDLVVVNGRFFVRGFDETHSYAVFELVPGAETYRPTVAAAPGEPSLMPGPLTVYEDRLYFAGRAGEGGAHLWSYDPASGETQAVAVPVPLRLSDDFTRRFNRLVPFDGKLFFVAEADEEEGLWAYDPETGAVGLAAPFEGADRAQDFLAHGDRLYFRIGRDGVWYYEAGAESVSHFAFAGVQFRYLQVVGKALLVEVLSGEADYKLCLYDGGFRCHPDLNTPGVRVLGDTVWFTSCEEEACTYTAFEATVFDAVPEEAPEMREEGN